MIEALRDVLPQAFGLLALGGLLALVDALIRYARTRRARRVQRMFVGNTRPGNGWH